MPEGEWITTYDEHRRRGACSCGNWRCYGVSRHEFDRAARRHLAWHAKRERRPMPPPPVSGGGADLGVFAETLAAIERLPTTTRDEG